MTLGEKIERLRRTRGLTKIELAKKLGLKDSSVISHWTKDRFKPEPKNLIKLGQIFKKPMEYFVSEESETYEARVFENAKKRTAQIVTNVQPHRIIHVGVIGEVSAEKFRIAEESIPDEYLPVMVEGAYDKKIFALRIKGDCMNPTARDGDYAIVANTDFIDSGKLAVLRIDGECTLKRVFREKTSVELRPDNPAYKTIKIRPEKLSVVGQVIGFFRKP
ncbi:MAG: XRE family transcriptional regulator [Elusimicrobia bacterium]|nr:XRE family transcriptional regulator [Elusimicrobiota bacterium]